jgi:hypothetical protein
MAMTQAVARECISGTAPNFCSEPVVVISAMASEMAGTREVAKAKVKHGKSLEESCCPFIDVKGRWLLRQKNRQLYLPGNIMASRAERL